MLWTCGRYLGPDYGDGEQKGPQEVVNAAQLPALAKQSFPLCMQVSHCPQSQLVLLVHGLQNGCAQKTKIQLSVSSSLCINSTCDARAHEHLVSGATSTIEKADSALCIFGAEHDEQAASGLSSEAQWASPAGSLSQGEPQPYTLSGIRTTIKVACVEQH